MKYLHVGAGMLALFSGAVALAAVKGGALHRKSGMVFVYAMLVMSSTGAVIAALHPPVVVVNVIAGALTFYLVGTAVLAVRRRVLQFERLDVAAMWFAAAVAAASFVFGIGMIGRATRTQPPAIVYFMFGIVALLAAMGDLRVLRAGKLEGRRRLARHLWRMCFAFFVAAASFFLGPPQRLPPFLRGSPLRPIPVLLVLLTMFYWMARVRSPRALRVERTA